MGLLVHMTAPTIHAGWWGQITLEICNLGPFTLALQEGDGLIPLSARGHDLRFHLDG